MELPKALRQFLTGGTLVVLIAGAGVASEAGIDHGFLKDAWEALKVPSPPIAMGAVVVAWLFWVAWNKDREEHRLRTIDYVNGQNTAARNLEAARRENVRVRDENRRFAERIAILEERATLRQSKKRRSTES